MSNLDVHDSLPECEQLMDIIQHRDGSGEAKPTEKATRVSVIYKAKDGRFVVCIGGIMHAETYLPSSDGDGPLLIIAYFARYANADEFFYLTMWDEICGSTNEVKHL